MLCVCRAQRLGPNSPLVTGMAFLLAGYSVDLLRSDDDGDVLVSPASFAEKLSDLVAAKEALRRHAHLNTLLVELFRARSFRVMYPPPSLRELCTAASDALCIHMDKAHAVVIMATCKFTSHVLFDEVPYLKLAFVELFELLVGCELRTSVDADFDYVRDHASAVKRAAWTVRGLPWHRLVTLGFAVGSLSAVQWICDAVFNFKHVAPETSSLLDTAIALEDAVDASDAAAVARVHVEWSTRIVAERQYLPTDPVYLLRGTAWTFRDTLIARAIRVGCPATLREVLIRWADNVLPRVADERSACRCTVESALLDTGIGQVANIRLPKVLHILAKNRGGVLHAHTNAISRDEFSLISRLVCGFWVVSIGRVPFKPSAVFRCTDGPRMLVALFLVRLSWLVWTDASRCSEFAHLSVYGVERACFRRRVERDGREGGKQWSGSPPPLHLCARVCVPDNDLFEQWVRDCLTHLA